MPKRKPKHAGGRPPLPEGTRVIDRPSIVIRFTLDNHKWLMAQDKSANQIVNELVDAVRISAPTIHA